MRSLPALIVCVLLAGCATSGGVATLADGRTGSFPILTRTFPTATGAVEQPGTVTGDLSVPGGSDRVPAGILLHSCSRVTPNVTEWAHAPNRMGYARLINEADMAGGPVQIFHGTADDRPTIDHCREWVPRRRAAGKDVSLVEYEGARHAFDVPFFARPQGFAEVVNSSGCAMFQQEDGTFTDAGGKRFSGASPCMTRGASMGYDGRSHQQSVADLRAFFEQAFARR